MPPSLKDWMAISTHTHIDGLDILLVDRQTQICTASSMKGKKQETGLNNLLQQLCAYS